MLWPTTSPDAVNAEGTKWWLDRDSTGYGANKGLKVQVWCVETPDGKKSRLITNKGQIVFESTKLESIGYHLDMLAFLAQSKELEGNF